MDRTRITKLKFTISREKAYLLALTIGASLYLWAVTPSFASEEYKHFTKQEIESLIVSNSKKYGNVNQNFALGLARILSNFDSQAIGPGQKVGVFQLHPNEFSEAYTARQLLSPSLNINLGLRKISRLIDEAYGDKKRALTYYHQDFLVGPWPNSKILKEDNSFFKNVMTAQTAFEQDNNRNEVDFVQHSEHNFGKVYFAKEIKGRDLKINGDLSWKQHINITNLWLELFEKNGLQLNVSKMSPSLFSTF